MSCDEDDPISEVANDLDELKTAVDELEEHPPAKVKPKTIHALKRALERAGEAADTLDNQKE